CPAFEVLVTYPFHPRSGELVIVVGSKRHAGAEHFVIQQPDRTLALLPAWMTEPGRAATPLLALPRLPVERLADLRALLDELMASCSGDLPRCKGADHGETAIQAKGSIRGTDAADGACGRSPQQAERPASGTAGGGSRRAVRSNQPGTARRRGGRR